MNKHVQVSSHLAGDTRNQNNLANAPWLRYDFSWVFIPGQMKVLTLFSYLFAFYLLLLALTAFT